LVGQQTYDKNKADPQRPAGREKIHPVIKYGEKSNLMMKRKKATDSL